MLLTMRIVLLTMRMFKLWSREQCFTCEHYDLIKPQAECGTWLLAECNQYWTYPYTVVVDSPEYCECPHGGSCGCGDNVVSATNSASRAH